MANSSALLGFNSESHETTTEEDDLMERSLKKIKGGEKPFEPGSSQPISYADIEGSPKVRDTHRVKSYKNSLLGVEEEETHDEEEEKEFSEGDEDREWRPDEGNKFTGMKVVERQRGEHACPDFVLTEEEEARLQKTMEEWSDSEVIRKEDWLQGLGNKVEADVEDHYRALIDGPWMIYDNYLVVREWSPNFHPSGEVIEKVAVWVRFSGLPIEYYDNKMLHFIGNRIGRTVKVDRTTQSQARGKYARLCVEVDLTKPLLAMFQIKDRYYKVEYEGLHMLCLACGTFGHYKEGCVAKVNNTVWNGEQATENARKGGPANTTSVQEGPWKVVQKTRRPRKKVDGGKFDGTMVNEILKNTGSRYAILQENIPDSEEEVIGDLHDDNMVIVTTKDTQNHAKNSGLKKGMESVKRNIGGDYKVELVKNKTTTSINNGATPRTSVHQREENPRSSKK
ncbi:hypothetical protein A2U01_0009218, partial [Trifolium medium]|nr:hypothetical protein [Trifolium medium]